MASVSNVFDALQSSNTSSTSKKKRRNRKKAIPEETEASSLGPPPLPTPQDLEAQAAAAVSVEERLALWDKWTSSLQDEEGLRRGPYIDQEGKPAFFRSVLLNSKAMEILAETCVDAFVTNEQGPLLRRLFESVFGSMTEDVVQQLTMAVIKVASLARGKGPEIVFASKRALRDVVSAVKRMEIHGVDTNQSWKKKATAAKSERSSKKPFKMDKKAEVFEALEAVKTLQSSVDEVDDEGDALGSGVHRSVSDLQVTLSLAMKPVEEGMGQRKGRKGKKGPQTSPMIESLKQEEAAYAAEEARLNEEITSMEMRLKSLRSQLSSLHVTRQQVRQRKEAALQSLLDPVQSNGSALISPQDQSEAIERLEAVIAELRSSSGPSDDQKRELVGSYAESLERFFGLCLSRQEDLMKTVKFLKDSIQRRQEQEIKMREIASAAVAKDILKTQQHSKHELEQQLKDAMFDAGDLMIKVSRVETDLKHRTDFVRRHAPTEIDALENAAMQIKQTHNEIKRIAEEKREVVMPQKDAGKLHEGWKKVDTKEIIKEEEIRAREELAQKQAAKIKSPTASKQDAHPTGDVTTKPPDTPTEVHPAPPPHHIPQVIYVTPAGEPIPQYSQAPPMYMHPPHDHHPHPVQGTHVPQGDEHPMPIGYYPIDAPRQPMHVPMEMDDARPSGSKPRMAWRKIEDQNKSDKPDLPTPGEARQQGKL